jgi:septal ring factor EnvC (AmiA/AmiB activator)
LKKAARFFVGLLLAGPWPVAGAIAAPDKTAAQLKAVEQDLEKHQTEQEALERESAKVARDLARAREMRVALARDIQDQEYAILTLETRIADLEKKTNAQAAALSRRDYQMGQTLLALERLALHPADALSLTPLAPEDAVRAAILLRAAVPEIVMSTTALQKELAELYRRRRAIVSQREEVAAAAAMLVERRAKLDALIETKTQRQAVVATRKGDVAARVTELSRQAEDLRALFAKLAEEKAKRDAAQRLARAAEAARRAEDAAAAKARGKAPPAETDADTAARPFSSARGTMPFPAIGKLTTAYGQSTGGHSSKGITITTRAGATVVTPYDGVVAFAGPFRGYGQLLIIEHSEGYHTLIAGLARIDATVGQKVLAGEPVGVMANEGETGLYVELRRDGEPINPLPWLAARGPRR